MIVIWIEDTDADTLWQFNIAMENGQFYRCFSY